MSVCVEERKRGIFNNKDYDKREMKAGMWCEHAKLPEASKSEHRGRMTKRRRNPYCCCVYKSKLNERRGRPGSRGRDYTRETHSLTYTYKCF